MDLSFFKDFAFEPIKHRYCYKGREMPHSVTGIVGKINPFNRLLISSNIANALVKGTSTYQNLHIGLDQIPEKDRLNAAKKLVLSAWDSDTSKGTRVHEVAEKYILERKIYDGEEFKEEFGFIVQFLEDQKKEGFIPYTVELRVGDPEFTTMYHGEDEVGIGGSVDLVLYNPLTGKYKISDWKRTKPNDHEREKWMLQLYLYHSILKKRAPGYDPCEFLIAQIRPPNLIVHKFTIRECEIYAEKKLFPPKLGKRATEGEDNPHPHKK